MSTLADLLFADDEDVAQVLGPRLEELGDQAFAPVPTASELPRRLAGAIAACLDSPVADLVVTAHEQHDSIRTECASTAHEPGASSTVVLVQQDLTSTQQPTVDAVVAGETISISELVLSIALHFDALSVTVREGRINGLGDATASSSAELAIRRPGSDSEPHVIAAKQTDDRVIFRAISFVTDAHR